MEEDLLNHCLQLWDQAGERPYEVLKQENLYDQFMNYIKDLEINNIGNLFRGTRRHSELNIGDKITYDYPSSWSESYENSLNFVAEETIPVIIKLNTNKNKLFGIYNNQNSYNEKEYILYPFETTIKNKYLSDNIIVLEI